MSIKEIMRKLAKNLNKVQRTENTGIIYSYRSGVMDTLSCFEPLCNTGAYPLCKNDVTCPDCSKQAFWNEFDKAFKEGLYG